MWKLVQTGNIWSRYKCFSCSCANPHSYSTQAKICPLLNTCWWLQHHMTLLVLSNAGSTNSTSNTSSGSTFPTATWPPWSSVAQTISISNNTASNTSSTGTWPPLSWDFRQRLCLSPSPSPPIASLQPSPPPLSLQLRPLFDPSVISYSLCRLSTQTDFQKTGRDWNWKQNS